MKAKRIAKVSLQAAALLVLVSLGILAWIFTPGLRTPVPVPVPEYWPTDGWRTIEPEDLGFNAERLAEGFLDIKERQIGIDSLLIIRDGYIVVDAHFSPYDGTFPHDVASVTKSVMTTLIAIAVDQGRLDLDQPVVSFFTDRTIANLDEHKERITVRHLVGMVNGMESGCFVEDEPTLDAMRSHPDWVQAALDRPMVSEPGTRFCYDSPGMHLLSAILQEATGMSTLEFARIYLFEPLGIDEVIWEADPQGYTHGWGDLHLLPEDAAKIGYLWLHRGAWEDRQIVPEAWVLDSVRVQSRFVGADYGYGYGWWVSPVDFYASGRNGQNVRVISSLNTVVITTGGGFDIPEIESFLIPALLHTSKPLPADPEGQAALDAALIAIQKNAEAEEFLSPETAREISGRTYLCDNNAVEIWSIRMEFDDPHSAALIMRYNGADVVWPIGLDGNYLQLPGDGDALRGYWEDSQIFLLEIFDIGQLTRQLQFNGDMLEVRIPEINLTLQCQAQNP